MAADGKITVQVKLTKQSLWRSIKNEFIFRYQGV